MIKVVVVVVVVVVAVAVVVVEGTLSRQFLPPFWSKRAKIMTEYLRPSLPEDQAGVIHAISPFWMRLCQIKGTTQQL